MYMYMYMYEYSYLKVHACTCTCTCTRVHVLLHVHACTKAFVHTEGLCTVHVLHVQELRLGSRPVPVRVPTTVGPIDGAFLGEESSPQKLLCK